MKPKRIGWAQGSWFEKAIAIAAPLIFFLLGAVGLYRASYDLQSLTKVQGLVEWSTLQRGNGKANPLEVLFSLRGNNTLFGVYKGQDQISAQSLSGAIQPMDSITLYYDSVGAEENGASLHVYQIQKGPQVLLSLQDSQHRNRVLGTMMASGGVILAVLMVVFFRTGIFAFHRV